MTQNETKPTPVSVVFKNGAYLLVSANGHEIAAFRNGYADHTQREAIAHRLNSHDALVEAARVARAELGRAFTHAQDCEDGNPDHIARAMQSLQDALKLAGVEL